MMRIEREIILSVLKMTQKGMVQKELIAKDARTPIDIADEVLRTLHEKNLIALKEGNTLATTPSQRLMLAIEAIKQGADSQRTCRFLEWREFENIAATAFEANGYKVKKNFHFKGSGDKRWEIDLIACKQPRIVCADCKHWQHGWSRAAIEKTVATQVERTRALAALMQKFTDKLGLNRWTNAILVPIVIALNTSALKTYNDTPVVSVLQIQDFINELPTQTILLTHFSTIIKLDETKLTEF